jgi:hypothetical protein
MITTGSVRGKCWVRQDGQSRRQPASTTLLGAPQFEQKRSQVGGEKVLACLERLGVGRIERDGESGNALD